MQCSAPFKIGCRKYLLIAYEVREKEVQAKQPLVQSAPGASATSAAAAPMSTRAPLANATAQDQATIAIQEATKEHPRVNSFI